MAYHSLIKKTLITPSENLTSLGEQLVPSYPPNHIPTGHSVPPTLGNTGLTLIP